MEETDFNFVRTKIIGENQKEHAIKLTPAELDPIDLSKEEEIQLIEESTALKKTVLELITKANSGHPGGSLSAMDVILCLYEKILHYNPQNPDDPDRDRFVLSKGHCVPALYTVLAHKGFFPEEKLVGLRQFGSPLQGHPKKGDFPGIEISTGSLGQGLANSVGIALAAKVDKKEYHTFVMLGDGECDEGCVWEASMAAAHFNLDNLTGIVDRNGIQLEGATEKLMSLEPLADKFAAFGWNVIEIDGTSIRQILMAINKALTLKGKPTMIISYIYKGQGVSFMQNTEKFHGKAPTAEELENACNDLDGYKDEQIQKLCEPGDE